MDTALNLSVIISIVGVLVVLTNIIVQVVKKVTWDKLPTNILAMVVSLVMTLGAFFAYCSIKGITVVWYMVFAAVVLAFMVAYAAMFGFDTVVSCACTSHSFVIDRVITGSPVTFQYFQI